MKVPLNLGICIQNGAGVVKSDSPVFSFGGNTPFRQSADRTFRRERGILQKKTQILRRSNYSEANEFFVGILCSFYSIIEKIPITRARSQERWEKADTGLEISSST